MADVMPGFRPLAGVNYNRINLYQGKDGLTHGVSVPLRG